ncbi:hypothetical protein CDD83_2154 [Cordyceps sp. RAO-2017]|nr:hypothetical protein CDD83_2154 [Cordyceps sp. RAO-2017]
MRCSTIACAALLAAAQACGAADSPTHLVVDKRATLVQRQENDPPKQSPSTFPRPNAPTSHGCYKSAGNMTTHNVENMSSGSCNEKCKSGKFSVSGLQGPNCFCGFAYPPDNAVVDDKKCGYPCPSYPLEACGGLGQPGFWSVFNTGVNVNPPTYDEASSTSSSASQPTSPPKSDDPDRPAPTAVQSPDSPPPSSPPPDNKGGAKTGGIVAGCVAAAVVALLIGAAIFFFVRRKRNAEIEEEHRRNAAVNAFINGSKPPGSSGSISMTDARLDPVLANRRMSDGSIADNEDYSRRILRVTNA